MDTETLTLAALHILEATEDEGERQAALEALFADSGASEDTDADDTSEDEDA